MGKPEGLREKDHATVIGYLPLSVSERHRGKISGKEAIKLVNGDNECARHDGTLALRKDDRFPSFTSDWQKVQEFSDTLKQESWQIAKPVAKPGHTWMRWVCFS